MADGGQRCVHLGFKASPLHSSCYLCRRSTTAKNGRAPRCFRLCAVNGGFAVPVINFNKLIEFMHLRAREIPRFQICKSGVVTPLLSDGRLCARRPNRWTPRSRRGCIRHP
jgi:hypothetical protein